ncbi:uncharacterized protein LOC134271990 [Saccostrea cucullata]|uniref:uncharacterized protein LOC134271990 n=1 Tax=Saccostrea cuccullata TaxID=36930 RepID=UPI002ED60C9B
MEGLFSHQTRRCFLCKKDAEYYCKDCRKNFCLLCKEKHLIDLDSYLHNVVTIEVKYGNTTCEETCEIHPRNVYEYWCRTCKCPLCKQCIGHRGHGTNPLNRAYERHIILNREKISKVRSEVLHLNIALLAQIKNIVLHPGIHVAKHQLKTDLKMMERAKSLQTALEFVHEQSLIFGIRNYIVKRLIKLRKQVIVLEKSIYKFDIYANKPVQCLSFLKTSPLFHYSFSSFSLYALNRQNVINMFGEVENMESGKPEIEVEFLFEALPDVTLKQSVEVGEIRKSSHISYASSDSFWINNHKKLLHIHKNGESLFRQKRVLTNAAFPCVHSVTTTGDLIFIDLKHNICEMEKEQTIPNVLIKKSKPWKPCCVFSSLLNGNLLIGMWRKDTDTSIVSRFDKSGNHIQSFQYHENGESLYKKALYITENQNGDVIVSDVWYGVVVVNREGAHRFSYRGHPSVRKLSPNGICTDALMNILVCDYNTNSVHMIDIDGRFLRYLLTKKHNIMEPRSICYDHENHLVWVGSNLKGKGNNLFCYRHINRKYL